MSVKRFVFVALACAHVYMFMHVLEEGRARGECPVPSLSDLFP